MENLRVVIIDDESGAREYLRTLIKENIPEIRIVGEADSVPSGYRIITDMKPDLVFLDIRLGNITGFELLKKPGIAGYNIIFVTAYEEFAIRAFKFNAIDYLLKPADPDELRTAVSMAIEKVAEDEKKKQLQGLIKHIEGTANPERIAIRTQNNIHFVTIENIIRCQADEGYTHIFLNNMNKLLVARPLREYEEMLGGYGFYRVHQSHLINAHHIVRFARTNETFELTSGDIIPLSSRRHHLIDKIFRQ